MAPRIALVAAGSRGDVQPLVALGHGLRRSGYRVRIVALETFRELAAGLEFVGVPVDPQRFIDEHGLRESVGGGAGPIAFLRRYRAVVEATYGPLLGIVWEALADVDAVGFGTLTIMAHPLADARGIPRFAVPLQPLTRSRAYPSLAFPPSWGKLGAACNLATHLLEERLWWAAVGGVVSRGLRDVLGRDPFPRGGPYDRIYADEGFPFVYGFSPTVVPHPPDWPAWHVVTGFWYLDAEESLPDEVAAFLDAGPAPVYVGFGSLPVADPPRAARTVVEAVRRAGRRAILLRGWAELDLDGDHDDVLVVDEVPHALLFPRVAAIVHHGGAGTTAAALRAGRPQVVVPHFADQPFWAARVHELGVAPPPLRPRRLDADRLAAALDRACSAEVVRRAAEVGERIAAEDGVGRAVAVLARFLDRGRVT